MSGSPEQRTSENALSVNPSTGTDLKKCFKCGKRKPLNEFYKHPEMRDGHLGKCKECNKKDVRENYFKNRGYYAKYEQKRYQTPKRKKYVANACRLRSKRYPEKAKAHYLTSNAIRDGRLTKQPCEVCGKLKVEAHHDDYSKPLDVRWLCRKHHLAVHGKQAYEF